MGEDLLDGDVEGFVVDDGGVWEPDPLIEGFDEESEGLEMWEFVEPV